MEDRKYYVYILFKTYKKGNYVYGDLHFDMEPFYVGKGTGDRLRKSGYETGCSNRHKANILNKIISNDMTVTSIKYNDNLSENDALHIETLLINTIGRNDLGSGPLSNLCDGGKGSCGIIPGRWKPVLKYDLSGNLIAEYKSIGEASQKNPGSKNISYCCLGRRDTSGGYIWRYKDPNSSMTIDVETVKNRTHTGSFPVGVIQKNIEGGIINEFHSIKEAAETSGCSPSKIVLVCQGKRKNTKGYFFEYKK